MGSPQNILREGAAILEPLLLEYGFAFVEGASGKSSGGHYARGSFVRGDRLLELHFRRSLGLVRYHVGDASVAHDEYVRLVTGGRGEYPGYSSDPLDGFRHLLTDLERHGRVFLSGSDEEFQELHKSAAKDAGR